MPKKLWQLLTVFCKFKSVSTLESIGMGLTTEVAIVHILVYRGRCSFYTISQLLVLRSSWNSATGGNTLSRCRKLKRSSQRLRMNPRAARCSLYTISQLLVLRSSWNSTTGGINPGVEYMPPCWQKSKRLSRILWDQTENDDATTSQFKWRGFVPWVLKYIIKYVRNSNISFG